MRPPLRRKYLQTTPPRSRPQARITTPRPRTSILEMWTWMETGMQSSRTAAMMATTRTASGSTKVVSREARRATSPTPRLRVSRPSSKTVATSSSSTSTTTATWTSTARTPRSSRTRPTVGGRTMVDSKRARSVSTRMRQHLAGWVSATLSHRSTRAKSCRVAASSISPATATSVTSTTTATWTSCTRATAESSVAKSRRASS